MIKIYIVIILIFLCNCFLAFTHSSTWEIVPNIKNNCMVYSEYEMPEEINPIIYILSKVEIQHIISHDKRLSYELAKLSEKDLLINLTSKLYLLSEYYEKEPFSPNDENEVLLINNEINYPLLKYSLDIEVLDPYFYFLRVNRENPRRLRHIKYKKYNDNDYSRFSKKGKIVRRIYKKENYIKGENIYVRYRNQSQIHTLINKGKRNYCRYF